MNKEKAERIIKIVNWVRFIILVVFLTFLFVGLSKAQTFRTAMPKADGAESKYSAYVNCYFGI
ncbi:MAG: hypothetical protein II852_16335 [Bacteroidales bacterium]|nr:hypothetical protein [Bacteroidales bacterium]